MCNHCESKAWSFLPRPPPPPRPVPSASSQLRDVRRELQDVLHERDVAVARGATVDDLEETVLELRRHNKELEDQVRLPGDALGFSSTTA